MLRHGAKGMKLNKEARTFEMRMLENEMLNLVGERREEAMEAHRKLIFHIRRTDLSDEIIAELLNIWFLAFYG